MINNSSHENVKIDVSDGIALVTIEFSTGPVSHDFVAESSARLNGKARYKGGKALRESGLLGNSIKVTRVAEGHTDDGTGVEWVRYSVDARPERSTVTHGAEQPEGTPRVNLRSIFTGEFPESPKAPNPTRPLAPGAADFTHPMLLAPIVVVYDEEKYGGLGLILVVRAKCNRGMVRTIARTAFRMEMKRRGISLTARDIFQHSDSQPGPVENSEVYPFSEIGTYVLPFK